MFGWKLHLAAFLSTVERLYSQGDALTRSYQTGNRYIPVEKMALLIDCASPCGDKPNGTRERAVGSTPV